MNTSLPRPLTPQEIAEYREDGCLCLRDMFDSDWAALLRRGLEKNIAAPTKHFLDLSPPNAPGGFITDMWAWRGVPEYEAFVRQSPVGEMVGLLTGKAGVNFVEDNFFVKRAGVQVPTPWHQDRPYYEIEGSMCSVWVALDDYAKIDCLEFVAGSHRWGKIFLPVDFAPGGNRYSLLGSNGVVPEPYTIIPDIDGHRSSYRILSWELRTGDCVVFDAMTIHGNQGNRESGGGRRISFRFVGDDAVYAPNAYVWSQLGGDHGLAPGQRLACDAFPTVWQREVTPADRQGGDQ